MIKGCNIFWVKNWAGGHIIVQQEKLSRTPGRNRSMRFKRRPVTLYKILHLLFFPVERTFCALRLENLNNYQRGLDAGPLEFQFLRPRGYLTNSFKTLSLCFGVIGKTAGLISRNNFVKKIFVCIGHRDNVLARCN